jgi:hypothetical protein
VGHKPAPYCLTGTRLRWRPRYQVQAGVWVDGVFPIECKAEQNGLQKLCVLGLCYFEERQDRKNEFNSGTFRHLFSVGSYRFLSG